MANWIPGAKTYLGLAISLMGGLSQTLGWTWWDVVSADAVTMLNMIFEFVGLAIAAYGRAVAKPK